MLVKIMTEHNINRKQTDKLIKGQRNRISFSDSAINLINLHYNSPKITLANQFETYFSLSFRQ